MIKCDNNVCENRVNGICHRPSVPEIQWCGARTPKKNKEPNGPAQVAWLCGFAKCDYFVALKSSERGYCSLDEITKEVEFGCITYRSKVTDSRP